MENDSKPFWRRCETTGRDRHNRLRVRNWTLGWMGSWLAILFVVKFDYLPVGTLATLLTLASAALGVGTLFAYRHFLREADELIRKIELEALALAVGVGIVGGLTYFLLQHTVPDMEKDLLVVPFLMMLTHGLGVIFGRRRYS